MNAASRFTFTTLLEKRRSEILAQIARADQQTRVGMDKGIDEVDQSVANFNREFLFAEIDACRRKLRGIELALNRIAEATFGECERCGDEISPARLQAVPWARYCVRCQEKLETRRDRLAA